MVFLILNGTAKTKLTVLAFLYCGEFVKNSNGQDTVILHIAIILGMFLHLSVILSTEGGGVSPSAWWDTSPSRHPPGRHLPGRPPRQTDTLREDTPTPPRQTPPSQTPPVGRHSTWADTPGQIPLGRHPPGQTPPADGYC